LQRVRVIAGNNQVKTVMVCTQCLRSGKIHKAPVRNVPNQAG
jgi:ribosomal protein L28